MYLHCRSLIVLHSYLVVRKDIFTPHACNKPQEKKSLNTRICSDIDSTMYCVYVHNCWHLKVKTKITSSHHKPGIVREDWLLGFCCQLNNAYTCTICTLYNVLKTYYYLQRLTASFIILIVLKLRFTIRLNKITYVSKRRRKLQNISNVQYRYVRENQTFSKMALSCTISSVLILKRQNWLLTLSLYVCITPFSLATLSL